MDQGGKQQTYYQREREKRKAYQRKYREVHLEEVRKKDRERRRRTPKTDPIRIEKNVRVSFD